MFPTRNPVPAKTRSDFVSPLKSPTATSAKRGLFPSAMTEGLPNVPSPWPSRTAADPDPLPERGATRSSFPSPLKSPEASASGPSPTGTFVGPLKLPSPWPTRIETGPQNSLATARSGCASASKKPTTTAAGPLGSHPPTGIPVGAPKVPSPAPSSTETSSEKAFATARSTWPSALKSPTSSEIGPRPARDWPLSLKLPVPLPSSTLTPPGLFAPRPLLAVARSRSPSPLKSLATTASGARPETGKSVELKLSWANAGADASSQSAATAATTAPARTSRALAGQTSDRITAPPPCRHGPGSAGDGATLTRRGCRREAYCPCLRGVLPRRRAGGRALGPRVPRRDQSAGVPGRSGTTNPRLESEVREYRHGDSNPG